MERGGEKGERRDGKLCLFSHIVGSAPDVFTVDFNFTGSCIIVSYFLHWLDLIFCFPMIIISFVCVLEFDVKQQDCDLCRLWVQKHRVPDRVKLSFVIFDIWALWRSGIRVHECQKLQMTA